MAQDPMPLPSVATSARRIERPSESAAATSGATISRIRSAPTSASEPVEDVGGDGGALDAEVLDEEHEHEQAEEDIEQEQ